MKWILLAALFLMGRPDPPTGVEETCEDQYEECLKMCDEGLDEELTCEECLQECKEELDFCYRLP